MHPEHDSEYLSTFYALVLGRAEETLREAHDLREQGYQMLPVEGQASIVWRALDGRFLTHERALSEVWGIPEAGREGPG